MVSREFTGHIRAMRADTDYFGAEDFIGDKDIPLQIDHVVYDDALKVGAGKAKPTFYLVLKGQTGKLQSKRMLLNASRRKMLAAMYGGTAENWKGKWIWIYTAPVKNPAGGEDVLGMKIRNNKSAPMGVQPQPQPPVDDNHPPAPGPGESGEPILTAADRLVNYRIAINHAVTQQECGQLIDAESPPDDSNPHGYNQEQQKEIGRLFQERLALVRPK